MRIHAIETGRVRVKPSQPVGRGHGLSRRLAPLFDPDWTDWLPVYAYAIEHADGVILVDTGANEGLSRCRAGIPISSARCALTSTANRRSDRASPRSAFPPAT